MIKSLQYKGPLITDTSISGEQKKDNIMVNTPFCLQLSSDRWMLISHTRGFTCIDDDRIPFYQIRADSPVGPVITEKPFYQAQEDWDPLGDGNSYYKVHAHTTAFGVPKGALVEGRRAENENIFYILWHMFPRKTENGLQIFEENLHSLIHLEGFHFCLNESGNDIESLSQIEILNPVNHDPSDIFPIAQDGCHSLNQWVSGAVPFNSDCQQWVEMGHFGGNVAPLMFQFNEASKRYEWIKTGPAVADNERQLSEASINQYNDEWIISLRSSSMGAQT
ncbi:MAG: hypothetical protein ACYTFY_19515, partial [Planctomycetota bacterium]